jgi:hypothetical protein
MVLCSSVLAEEWDQITEALERFGELLVASPRQLTQKAVCDNPHFVDNKLTA